VIAMQRHGVKVPTEALLKELAETISEFGSNYDHHFDKLLLRLPRRVVYSINRSIVIAAAIAAYHDAKFRLLRPFPEVIPSLRELARTTLIRGIITDGLEIKQTEKLIRLKVTPMLTARAIFISDQIGISKPNPKIYLRACDDLGISPAQAMYVGDHPVKDIDAANAAGLTTVLVNRGGRHSKERGRTAPSYSITSFNHLLHVLRRDFRVAPSRKA